MPLYEYRCKQCGHQFEKLQGFSAPDEKECYVCHGELERLISAPAVQFKGSGFYSTDYPSKSSKAPASNSGEGGGDSKASEKSGDSKGSEKSSDKGGSSSSSDKGAGSSSTSGDSSSAPAASSSGTAKKD